MLAFVAAGVYTVRAGLSASVLEFAMHRIPVNKHRSAKTFKKNVRKTKVVNMRAAPMRGGIRL